jgi:hypothetical protein
VKKFLIVLTKRLKLKYCIMESFSQFPCGLRQRKNINFVLDIAPEMKIKEGEVG